MSQQPASTAEEGMSVDPLTAIDEIESGGGEDRQLSGQEEVEEEEEEEEGIEEEEEVVVVVEEEAVADVEDADAVVTMII